MAADQSVLHSGEDEIDLREMFAVLRRRSRWVFGGGLLGLALSAGVVSLKWSEARLLTAGLIVDTSQSPCNFSRRNLNSLSDSPSALVCVGELETTRFRLRRMADNLLRPLVNNSVQFDYKVEPFSFGVMPKVDSATQLVLRLTFPPNLSSEVAGVLAQIKQQMTEAVVSEANGLGANSRFGPTWIVVEEPSKTSLRHSFSRSLALGLLGGLVVGAGSAVIADRRSNRVYSQAELLRRLSHPLRLGLPAGPLTTPAVQVLVGQLATQLDQSLSWRVLSIARQHEAVAPLAQLLQQQGGSDLQCNIADPLLSAVLRFEPLDKPTGLLLVVEAGFNSARALEEARLLISQMNRVQAVGVVLIGAPLPEELSPSAAG